MLHPLNLRHTSPSPPPGCGRQKTRVPVVGSREACAQGPDRQRRRGLPRRREPEQDQPRSGSLQDEEGKPVMLRCMRNAEAKVAGSEFLESISTSATSRLVEESIKLVYGKDTDAIGEGRLAGIQTLSGTGACCLFAEFQWSFYPRSKVYFPDPTWSNHHSIWKDAEVPQGTFSYYNPKSKGLNFPALIDDIKVQLLC